MWRDQCFEADFGRAERALDRSRDNRLESKLVFQLLRETMTSVEKTIVETTATTRQSNKLRRLRPPGSLRPEAKIVDLATARRRA
jgi:hypothetical protein